MSAFNLRTRIFVPVFAVACVASLAWGYSRPAVFLSSARLQVESAQEPPDLLTEAQTLTSSALLAKVARAHAGMQPAALQEMLGASPVSGTNVIELRAEGGERELLPRILATWIDAYRQGYAETRDKTAVAAAEDARATAGKLKESLAAKRAEVEAFRRKHDIVSLEREENQSMARLKGLNAALNDARSREVGAESKVNAMRENAAAGRAVRPAGDKAIIADLEKRAIELRERMKEFEHDYTPQYLAIDTKYKALRSNLTRLEQQIERERQSSAQQAMQSAEEDLASARQTTLRLQKELSERKQDAQSFSTRFAEHAALVAELGRLEEAVAGGNEQLARLEAAAKGKAAGPKVTVLSQPSLPDRPLRPDYTRDALLGIAGSGVLGLLAVWFLEFFRRSGMPQPAAPTVQPIIQIAITPGAIAEALLPAQRATALPHAEIAVPLPRELSGAEVDALLSAAPPDGHAVIAALLGGRTPVAGADGAAMAEEAVGALVARAARDAHLANPDQVTPEVLRRTFIAHQIRQRG